MSYTIEDIARIIGARRIGDRPAAIDWLLTDSRSLSFPEETLFFALPTKRNDGTVISVICMRAACVILWSAKRG